jgi:peptidoglycan/LPS O-acetylase OafA/YrhL
MLWLGLVSYGIYLWQATWLEELKRLGMRPGPAIVTAEWLLLGFAGTILLGAASYYFVERPALGLKRLVPERRRTTITPAAEAATAVEN